MSQEQEFMYRAIELAKQAVHHSGEEISSIRQG